MPPPKDDAGDVPGEPPTGEAAVEADLAHAKQLTCGRDSNEDGNSSDNVSDIENEAELEPSLELHRNVRTGCHCRWEVVKIACIAVTSVNFNVGVAEGIGGKEEGKDCARDDVAEATDDHHPGWALIVLVGEQRRHSWIEVV